MPADSNTACVRAIDRIDPQLRRETFEAIDARRRTRPADTSRKIWIGEAIDEDLARDRGVGLKQSGSDHAWLL